MTYQEVKAMVQSIGIPYAYYQFTNATATPPPFVCWYFDGSNDEPADNTNWAKIRTLYIEIYTDAKDFALEKTVEDILAEHELFYEKSETYLGDERMMMETYQTQVVITGG